MSSPAPPPPESGPEPAGAPGPSVPPRPGPRPLVIGVTGGIASGKTVVARLLAGERGWVVSADEIAHAVLASDEVAARVRARFGEACLGPDGRPDRGALAERVFGDPEARSQLEGWIHPRVRARILECLNEAAAAGIPRVALDVPLLWENDEQHGFSRLCDAIVFVDADAEERDRRAVRTRGWNAGEVARREASQLALDEKRRRADFVLTNRGSLEELERAARELSDRLDRLQR